MRAVLEASRRISADLNIFELKPKLSRMKLSPCLTANVPH